MAEYRIEIGATERHRHIGIEPPIPQDKQDKVWEIITNHYRESSDAIAGIDNSVSSSGQLHSVIRLSIERYHTKKAADDDMPYIARKIANTLGMYNGNVVYVDEDIKTLTVDSFLFESRQEDQLIY